MNLDTTPNDQSFRFVIEDGSGNFYDAFMDLNGEYDQTGGYGFIDLRFKATTSTENKWTYLEGHDIIDVTTSAKIDEAIDACLVKFNAKIKDFFGEASNEVPLTGYDRVFWILKNGLKETGNVISRV